MLLHTNYVCMYIPTCASDNYATEPNVAINAEPSLGWSSYLDDDSEVVAGVSLEAELALVGEVVPLLSLDVEHTNHVTRLDLHLDRGSWGTGQQTPHQQQQHIATTIAAQYGPRYGTAPGEKDSVTRNGVCNMIGL